MSLTHPADRLDAAIARSGTAACVGIDPVLEHLPAALHPAATTPDAVADAFRAYGLGILDAVAPSVPAVKVQSACFERWGAPGVAARDALLRGARERGLVAILDAKRGDIGVSARHYAAAAVDAGAEWITVNPCLGLDSIEPYLDAGLGVYALLRTSNSGSDAVQRLPLADGRSFAEGLADLLESWGAGCLGVGGRSALGAVVGATKADEAAALRARMPRACFLVPGIGAQGGGAGDALPCFDAAGGGALLTASRSVIRAFATEPGPWPEAIAGAARRLAEEVAAALAGSGSGAR